MKYYKPNKKLLSILNPLLLLAGFLLFYFYAPFISFSFYGFWVGVFCAAWLMLTSRGNHIVGQYQDEMIARLPFAKWTTALFLLESSLFGAYWGISDICANTFPIYATVQPHLFFQTTSTFLTHYGLFPWAMYAVIAVGINTLAFRKQINAYTSNFLFPLLKQDTDAAPSILINATVRRSTIFSLAILLFFFSLSLINLILPLPKFVASGFQVVTLYATVFLLFFTSTKFAKRYITRIFSNHVSTAINFLVFAILFALALFLLSMIAYGAAEKEGLLQKAIAAPNFIINWIHLPWQNMWLIFSVVFWLSLTPLISSYIVRLSQGYRVRDMILAVLALPVIMTLAHLFLSSSINIVFLMHPILIKCISCVSFLIALSLLVKHAHVPNIINGGFPKNGIVKMRDPQPFFEKLVLSVVVMNYFYLSLGINGMSVFCFVFDYLIIPVFIVCVVMSVKGSV